MSSAFNKFNCFVQDLGDKLHNLNSDTFKYLLTNTAPVATNAVLSDITEISAGNGYTAGGAAVPSTAFSQSSGLATFTGSDTIWTASGGSFGPFRYAVLYNSTASGKNLVGWYDYGSADTTLSGETFKVSTPSGVFTLQ
jgi:hypothetical protein